MLSQVAGRGHPSLTPGLEEPLPQGNVHSEILTIFELGRCADSGVAPTVTMESSRDPLSPETQSAMGSVSPTDVIGLRAEVENLRRVMQEIRADRFEPPPSYT